MATYYGEEVFSKVLPKPKRIQQKWIFNDYLATQSSLKHCVNDSQPFPSDSLPQWQMKLQPHWGKGLNLTLMLVEGNKVKSATADCSFIFLDDNGDVIRATSHEERRFRTTVPTSFLDRMFGFTDVRYDYSETVGDVSTILSQSGKLIIKADIVYWGKVINLPERSVFTQLWEWWKGTKKT